MFPFTTLNTEKNINHNESYLIQKNVNESLEKEIQELKEALELNKTLTEYKPINATILSRNKSYWYNTITIDKGKKDGIKKDMAVITSKGLIGKISSTSYTSSEVKLITSDDINFKVSIAIKTNDVDNFAILNGLTYFGRRNSQERASKMYALIFDLDGINPVKLNNFLSGAYLGDAYPIPNYIVLSGHGVHLYYVFEYGISLFPNIKLQLKELKYALTEKIWNEYTSVEKKKQFQGINQGFRVIGGMTKEGADFGKTRAFRLNTTLFCLDQLNEYIPKEHRIDESKLFKESKLTLVQAQKKYPDWYEKVILNKNKI